MNNIEGTVTILDTLGIKPNYAELGRIYKMDQRTARKRYLGIENKKRGRKEESKLDKYKDIIQEKLSIPGINKKAVYMYIKMNVDINIGSYSNFNKYINKYKDLFIQSDKEVHLRFETAFGKQLQRCGRYPSE